MITAEHFPAMFATYQRHATEKRDIVATLKRHLRLRREERVLSVGTGGGELDLRLVESICEEPGELVVHCVEPNPVYTSQLEQDWGSTFHLEVFGQTFESLLCQETSYDLAVLSHIMYYFAGKSAMLHKIARALRPDGLGIFVVNDRAGYGSIGDFFVKSMGKIAVPPTYLAEHLACDLAESFVGIREFAIHSSVDVSEIFTRTPVGDDLMSFMIRYDAHALKEDERRRVIRFIESVAVHRDGRVVVPHHISAFVATPRQLGS